MDWGGVEGRVEGRGSCFEVSVWSLEFDALLVGCVVSLEVDVDDGAREGVDGDCDWA